MLTIDDLIKNKIGDIDRYLTLEIKTLGGEIKVRIPKVTEVQEIKNIYKDNYSKIADIIIFENCVEPRLNDNNLIKRLNCIEEPSKVVEKIFGEEIKFNIVEIIMDELDSKELVKKVVDIKN